MNLEQTPVYQNPYDQFYLVIPSCKPDSAEQTSPASAYRTSLTSKPFTTFIVFVVTDKERKVRQAKYSYNIASQMFKRVQSQSTVYSIQQFPRKLLSQDLYDLFGL